MLGHRQRRWPNIKPALDIINTDRGIKQAKYQYSCVQKDICRWCGQNTALHDQKHMTLTQPSEHSTQTQGWNNTATQCWANICDAGLTYMT